MSDLICSEPKIVAQWLGLQTYSDALAIQLDCHEKVCTGAAAGYLLGLEHSPAILTLGKNATLENLLKREEEFRERGVEVIRTDRGGEVTAHMPGQLVVYVILPMLHGEKAGPSHGALMPRQLVAAMERSLIDLLQLHNVNASVDEKYPGVWVGLNKIAALGIRVKSRVSYHGLAMNLTNDLTLFNEILPCGIANRGVVKLASLTGLDHEAQDIFQQLTPILSQHLGVQQADP